MSENQSSGQFPASRLLRFLSARHFRQFYWSLLIIALFSLVYFRLAALGMDYEWQWNRTWRQLIEWTDSGIRAGPLLDGLLMTLVIVLLGMIFSVVLGLMTAFMRLGPSSAISTFAKIYIHIFRNTPLLLQLFFVYFLIAPVFNLDPFWSAILALAAFEGAYMAEIFRSGLLSVNRAQWEGALSLGFNLQQALALVILPQAFRNTLPALTNQCVSVLKDSSLVGAIALADLTMRAQAIVAETFLAFEIWLLVGALYLVLAFCISLPALWIENKGAWR